MLNNFFYLVAKYCIHEKTLRCCTTHYALRTTHYALILSLLLPIVGLGQCPTGDLTFTTQAEVDAFAIDYPSCTSLSGSSVTFSGSNIVDLSAFSNISSVYQFSILNTSLINLSGLENVSNYGANDGPILTIIGNQNLADISALGNITEHSLLDLYIHDNPALNSLIGLEWIDNDPSDISIQNNDSLTNLEGLNNLSWGEVVAIGDNDNLQSLEGLDNLGLAQNLFIISNPNLIDLTGLISLYYSADFKIENNDSLTSLNGIPIGCEIAQVKLLNNQSLTDISVLENINFLNFTLQFSNNQNLAPCDTPFVCNFLQNEWNPNNELQTVIIDNNGLGCVTLFEVINSCQTVPYNNECDTPILLDVGDTFEFYNDFATPSPQTPSCNDVVERADIWFTFNSGDETSVDIITQSGYFLQLWEGICPSLTQVADACGGDSLNDITVSPNTLYYVQVWSANTGRMETGVFDILVQPASLSLNDTEIEGFSMFPNPANHQVAIQTTNIIDQVVVYDLLGKRLLERGVQDSSLVLDVSQFSKGVYLVKVVSGNKEVVRKLVVD